jgi:hypothetical protein
MASGISDSSHAALTCVLAPSRQFVTLRLCPPCVRNNDTDSKPSDAHHSAQFSETQLEEPVISTSIVPNANLALYSRLPS